MSLSDKTLQLFKDYATGKINSLEGFNVCAQEFYDYTMSDVNSSKLREELTIRIGDYEQIPGKLGYDGLDIETGKYKEAKPKLYTRDKAHSGNGNFSDLTMRKLDKLILDNVDVVVSYFAHNKLVYIMEFPVATIYSRLYLQVYDKCVVNKQKMCRSANFNYADYIDSNDLVIKYIDWDFIDKYPKIINRPFLKKLKEKRQYENTIEKLLEC
jgi:hypothetical protein